MSRYQKGKTNLDFTEASDSEWQWHQLGHMQVCTCLRVKLCNCNCTLLQTDNHTSTPPLWMVECWCGCRMPFLPPKQQRQSTEGKCLKTVSPKHSALEVFLNDMRYINPRFTYLLTQTDTLMAILRHPHWGRNTTHTSLLISEYASSVCIQTQNDVLCC